MTESQKELLAVFEVRVHDLLALCEAQKQKIEVLTRLLNEEQEIVQLSKQEIQALKIKCANLLTARATSYDTGDMKSAQERLQNLVREVEKCMALLNG